MLIPMGLTPIRKTYDSGGFVLLGWIYCRVFGYPALNLYYFRGDRSSNAPKVEHTYQYSKDSHPLCHAAYDKCTISLAYGLRSPMLRMTNVLSAGQGCDRRPSELRTLGHESLLYYSNLIQLLYQLYYSTYSTIPPAPTESSHHHHTAQKVLISGRFLALCNCTYKTSISSRKDYKM